MKYKWIELVNYAGIYNGMGLNQIRIDFTLCKTNKILIVGDNGSGKSTLMNAISINSDSNDNFIPTMEARKNVCIELDGIDYIIRYIHPVTNAGVRATTKGYIAKNIAGQLVELNPNGNVSSCRDIIYDEFNLDYNFMALSQLSSENRGLVDRKPADRKRLLSGIMNILDVYNGVYKTLSKKSATYKSTVKNLSMKINSLGNEALIQANLSSISNKIEAQEKQRDGIIEYIASIKMAINEYVTVLKNNNYDTVCSDLKDTIAANKSLKKEIDKVVKEYQLDSIDDNPITSIKYMLDKVNSSIVELDTIINMDRQQVPLLLAQREAECKELEVKNVKLNSLSNDNNYMELKNTIKKLRDSIAIHEDAFRKINIDPNSITKNDFEYALSALEELKNSSIDLHRIYDSNLISTVYANKEQIRLDLLHIQQDSNILQAQLEELSSSKQKLTVFETMREIASKLSNRPAECTIDNCEFIKSALDADLKYPKQEYESLLNKVNSLEESTKALKTRLSELDRNGKVLEAIDKVESLLQQRSKVISKLPTGIQFVNTFMDRFIQGDSFDDVNTMYSYMDYGNMIEEYRVLKLDLKSYEVDYKVYESTNEIIDSIIEDINTLNAKTNELANSIDSINDNIKTNELKLSKLKIMKDKLESTYMKAIEEYLPSLDKEQHLTEVKKSLESNTDRIQQLQLELEEQNKILGTITNDIKSNYAEKDRLNHCAQLLIEYKNELAMYNDKYSKIEKIKYYTSPNTGIQVIFMQLYMNKIIATANQLLGMLFGGEFILQPFIINESEFRIPCQGSGLLNDDISSMSNAQKSMISMILSFSILSQSSTKYNIIKLDEIDGALDSSNRNFFVDLLDKLMVILRCEQAFIISHNQELTSGNCDVIKLKTSSITNMGMSNIIWSYA